eukprot:7271858-Karenia_brevis.AAC.2
MSCIGCRMLYFDYRGWQIQYITTTITTSIRSRIRSRCRVARAGVGALPPPRATTTAHLQR